MSDLLLNLSRLAEEAEETWKQEVRLKKHTCSSSFSHSLSPKRRRVVLPPPTSLPSLCSAAESDKKHDSLLLPKKKRGRKPNPAFLDENGKWSRSLYLKHWRDNRSPEQIAKRKKADQEYHLAHKEERNARQRAHYSDHKEEINARNRDYYYDHKEEINARQRAYYLAHQEEMKAKARAYYWAHKEEVKAYVRAYYLDHQEEIKAYWRTYYLDHKEEINAHRRERYSNDPGFRARLLHSSRCLQGFKKIDQEKPSEAKFMAGLEQINQTFSDLTNHLIEKDDEGIGGAFLEVGLPFQEQVHMDHIVCCAAFDLTNPLHIRVCFHFTNLQLKLASINLSKSAKLPENFDINDHVKKMIDQINEIENNKWTCQEVLEKQKKGEIFGYIRDSEIWWKELLS